MQTIPTRENGIVGELHYASDAQRRTTVIMLNGSDGGIPSAKDADDLARSGYTVLSLAYFKNWSGKPDGVPAALREIPLEYFYRAIDWLKAQPQVDSRRVVLMGQSRGAELALLLGSRRPDIAGVVAFSPGSDVWHAVGVAGVPAWTADGKPVPYRSSATDKTLSLYDLFVEAPPMAAARIPVENIRGPVLLLSSKTDGVWPASIYADEITATLRKRGRPVQNVQFDDASHLLMGTGPGVTRFQIPGTTITFDFGGSAEGNTRARAEAWAAAKRYLAAVPPR
ncbi:MAG TPA: acyl-CoA thioester hydrolase/BAAT C-terminal domain-containing protein [Sphingomonas sp.]